MYKSAFKLFTFSEVNGINLGFSEIEHGAGFGEKFRKQVIPGDTLHLEVSIIKLKKNAGIGKGIAYVGDKKAAEGEFTFLIG